MEEISVTCRSDERALRTLQGLMMFGKKEPKRSITRQAILFGILALLMALTSLLFWKDDLPFAIFTIVASVLCLLAAAFPAYVYWHLPRRMLRKSKQKPCESRYVFRETAFEITAESEDGFRANDTLPYTLLIKVTETADYFALFIEKNRAFMIEKHTLSNTEIGQLRAWLTATPGLVCKPCQY